MIMFCLRLFANAIEVPGTLSKIDIEIHSGTPQEFNFKTKSTIFVFSMSDWYGEIKYNGNVFSIGPKEPIINVDYSVFAMTISTTATLSFVFSVFPHGSLPSSKKCHRCTLITDTSKEFSISYNANSNLTIDKDVECIWMTFPAMTTVSYMGGLSSWTDITVYKSSLINSGTSLEDLNSNILSSVLIHIRPDESYQAGEIRLQCVKIDSQEGPIIQTTYPLYENEVRSFPAVMLVPKFGINKMTFDITAGVFLSGFMAIYIHDYGSATFDPDIPTTDPLFETNKTIYFNISSASLTTIVFSAADLSKCHSRYVYGKNQADKFIATNKLGDRIFGTKQSVCIWIPTDQRMSVYYKIYTEAARVSIPGVADKIKYEAADTVNDIQGFLLYAVTKVNYYHPNITISFTKELTPINGRDYSYVYPTGQVQGKIVEKLSKAEMQSNVMYHFSVAPFLVYFEEEPGLLDFYSMSPSNHSKQSRFYYFQYPTAIKAKKDLNVYYIPPSHISNYHSRIIPIATDGNEPLIISSDSTLNAADRNITIDYKIISDDKYFLVMMAPKGATNISIKIDNVTRSHITLRQFSSSKNEVLYQSTNSFKGPLVLLIDPIHIQSEIVIQGDGSAFATGIYYQNHRNITDDYINFFPSFIYEQTPSKEPDNSLTYNQKLGLILGGVFGWIAISIILILSAFSPYICGKCCIKYCCSKCMCCCCCDHECVYSAEQSSATQAQSKNSSARRKSSSKSSSSSQSSYSSSRNPYKDINPYQGVSSPSKSHYNSQPYLPHNYNTSSPIYGQPESSVPPYPMPPPPQTSFNQS